MVRGFSQFPNEIVKIYNFYKITLLVSIGYGLSVSERLPIVSTRGT